MLSSGRRRQTFIENKIMPDVTLTLTNQQVATIQRWVDRLNAGKAPTDPDFLTPETFILKAIRDRVILLRGELDEEEKKTLAEKFSALDQADKDQIEALIDQLSGNADPSA